MNFQIFDGFDAPNPSVWNCMKKKSRIRTEAPQFEAELNWFPSYEIVAVVTPEIGNHLFINR